MSELSLLALNIANPSPERAHRQLIWLASRDEDVLVLTETKDSAGCRLLADAFTTAGYHVTYPIPENGDYGAMIASKVTAHTDNSVDGSATFHPATPTPRRPSASASG
jgi:exodeoxyribonuclease III